MVEALPLPVIATPHTVEPVRLLSLAEVERHPRLSPLVHDVDVRRAFMYGMGGSVGAGVWFVPMPHAVAGLEPGSRQQGGDDELEAVDRLTDRVIAALMEHGIEAEAPVVNRLVSSLLDAPIYSDFMLAVRAEAMHQQKRWGREHDETKEPEDWFWVLGHLGGKAVRAANEGDREKALHHTISSAALMANWHAHLKRVLKDKERTDDN